MAAIDRAAPERQEVLVGRAGAAVARAAGALLGGHYGRRVVVVAGKGNNGADGRDAAERLRRRGVRVKVLDARDAPRRLPEADLVVDAAYGTGLRGDYVAPDPGGAPVLAVDIPSGVDGLTGAACPGAVRADRTVTFAALKPGLVLFPGRARAGAVVVADIGLDVSSVRAHRVELGDVASWLPDRPADAHKWQRAVWLVAGSPGMAGAATLAARAAQRAGAGYVRLSIPGAAPGEGAPVEAVATALAARGWDGEVLADLHRFGAMVIGPGLGRANAAEVRRVVSKAGVGKAGVGKAGVSKAGVSKAGVAVVVDGDGLRALGRVTGPVGAGAVVLTPHDGEYESLMGARPDDDRLGAARRLAAASGAIVVLKGPTTVVARPDGAVLVVDLGDARLATAGTGDVLSGLLGALLAGGVDPFRAAGAAALLHARAGALGLRRGLVAGDLPDLIARAVAELPEHR